MRQVGFTPIQERDENGQPTGRYTNRATLFAPRTNERVVVELVETEVPPNQGSPMFPENPSENATVDVPPEPEGIGVEPEVEPAS